MSKKLWGGRFETRTATSVEAYTESVSFDWKLYAEDIAGSKAHARMLAAQSIITDLEAQTLVQGLEQVQEEIESGSFVWKKELEDVHMNIEARLTELVGILGGKLHTGRSRNDQVALDFRLYVVRCLKEWSGLLTTLITALLARAKEHEKTLLPGCTHLQPAQPVSLAQHLLAYCTMFRRDYERAGECLKRSNVCPLGAAALAGTTYPLNPQAVADDLGMDGIFVNSMDAVSDRDFVIESLSCASLIMAHLSRFNEEIILWAHPLFGFVNLPDAYSTGSSIMPQKKNPDINELMRGKTGRVYGALIRMLTIIKGLPLAYNRDMQEDKEAFFDTDTTIRDSLSIMAEFVSLLDFNPVAMDKAMDKGYLNATELADYLVAKNLPFRQAHHIAGEIVARAEQQKQNLTDFSLQELQAFSPLMEADVFEALSYTEAVERRVSPGGTGFASIKKQCVETAAWLSQVAKDFA